MKKYIYLLFLGLCFIINSNAQSLVPNYSFETYSVCPNGNPVNGAEGWGAYRESPDYYNSCADISSCVSVPSNCTGYQMAASGNAYQGIICYGVNSFDTVLREYLGAQLSTTLAIGQKYYVSFKVNLPKSTTCATNNIGILLSTIPYSYSNPAPIRNFAHVYSSSIITDTANWVSVSGSFIADSVYQYIMIGNFFDNAHTLKNMLDSQLSICVSYYFVDDICVSTDSMTCMGITGIKEQELSPQLTIYPNPSTSTFTIQLPTQQSYTLSVTDIAGRNVYKNKNATNIITIDASRFSSGVYFVKATNERAVLTGKLIKE
ncbi:MAG: T9SS type A sorting domain-containing protein [Bacteroidetes bacterium]|nr:T9SS type A sorting domain-containing protein [Bacteroidota bacterium]